VTGSRRGVLARRLSAGLVAAATLAVFSAAASAHHSDLADPNDVRGTLDVQTVKLDHEGGPPEWTVITFSRWKPLALWDRGSFLVWLDTSGDENAEYYAFVRSTGTDLEGSLWFDARHGADKRIRPLAVRRKSPDGVSIAIPLNKLDFGKWRTSYTWYVQTLFIGDRCRRTCIDRAPDEGAIEQWRPGMSPSPPA
jgi:hypothetical protein